jgi:hypothetical protein
MFKIRAFFYCNAVRLAICKGWYFAHSEKTLALALDDGMISLWEEALDHKTSLSGQLFIEVPVQSQESERSYNMFVLGDIDFDCFCTILRLNFVTVPIKWCFLEVSNSQVYMYSLHLGQRN